jgi:hypothetical protein
MLMRLFSFPIRLFADRGGVLRRRGSDGPTCPAAYVAAIVHAREGDPLDGGIGAGTRSLHIGTEARHGEDAAPSGYQLPIFVAGATVK